MSDQVNHPDHYNATQFEVVEVLEGLGMAPAFYLGSVFKYLCRSPMKLDSAQRHDPVEHLRKARWYASRLVPRWNDRSFGGMALELPTSQLLRSRSPHADMGLGEEYAEAMGAWLDVVREVRIHGRLLNALPLKRLVASLDRLITTLEQHT